MFSGKFQPGMMKTMMATPAKTTQFVCDPTISELLKRYDDEVRAGNLKPLLDYLFSFHRRKKGLTVAALAQSAGITSQAFYQIINGGIRRPKEGTLRGLAKALELPAGELIALFYPEYEEDSAITPLSHAEVTVTSGTLRLTQILAAKRGDYDREIRDWAFVENTGMFPEENCIRTSPIDSIKKGEAWRRIDQAWAETSAMGGYLAVLNVRPVGIEAYYEMYGGFLCAAAKAVTSEDIAEILQPERHLLLCGHPNDHSRDMTMHIVIWALRSAEEVPRIAKALIAAVEDAFKVINDNDNVVSCYIGIGMYPMEDVQNPSNVLRDASLGLAHALKKGKSSYSFRSGDNPSSFLPP